MRNWQFILTIFAQEFVNYLRKRKIFEALTEVTLEISCGGATLPYIFPIATVHEHYTIGGGSDHYMLRGISPFRGQEVFQTYVGLILAIGVPNNNFSFSLSSGIQRLTSHRNTFLDIPIIGKTIQSDVAKPATPTLPFLADGYSLFVILEGGSQNITIEDLGEDY